MKWSPDQQNAIATVAAWLRIRHAPFFYLAGYAGSGKTTLARHIASLQDGKVAYGAFTGKAAKVMRQKGCAGARTIHSMIYHAEINEETGEHTFTLKGGEAFEDVSLIIIDECSMVDKELGEDLLSLDVPVLVLGDPGQLPPVKGAGFFTAGKPTYMMTEIHRQAADSPIIRVASAIREGRFDRRKVKTAQYEGLTICHKGDLDPNDVTRADAVLVGRNITRERYNRRLREIRGFEGDTPQKGETLICLRNDRDKKISNGEVFVVEKRGRPSMRDGHRLLRYQISDPDDDARGVIPVEIYKASFEGADVLEAIPFKQRRGTQQFDYGYALTAHKAQGSQWPNVCVFDESWCFRENANRHLYTAVTRASEHLTLVV